MLQLLSLDFAGNFLDTEGRCADVFFLNRD
jgi:hypothetical protein